MPSEPTQDVIDAVTPYLEAQGIPGDLAALVWQALDAAGLTVVTKDAGTPMDVTDETECQRVRIPGMVGAFMIGVKVGTSNWVVCIEQTDKSGVTTRSGWISKGGGGDLLD